MLINFDNFLSLIQQVCSVHRKTKPEHVEIFPKLFRIRKIFDKQKIEEKKSYLKMYSMDNIYCFIFGWATIAGKEV